MWELLKDWRGWLADWPLYTSGVIGTVALIWALIWALTDGNAVGGALTGAYLIGLVFYSVWKDARKGPPGRRPGR